MRLNLLCGSKGKDNEKQVKRSCMRALKGGPNLKVFNPLRLGRDAVGLALGDARSGLRGVDALALAPESAGHTGAPEEEGMRSLSTRELQGNKKSAHLGEPEGVESVQGN